MLRRIFGPKRDEVKGGWKKLHNEEINDMYCSSYINDMYCSSYIIINDMYCSSYIIRVIKSRRMR